MAEPETTKWLFRFVLKVYSQKGDLILPVNRTLLISTILFVQVFGIVFAASPEGKKETLTTLRDTPAVNHTTSSQQNEAPSVSLVAGDKQEEKLLFTLTRLLNYSPHPLQEDLLRESPLVYNGNYYWFSICYKEEWEAKSDTEAYLQAISYIVQIVENNKVVRTIETPKIDLKTKIEKDQKLAIIKVAPYRIDIAVDSVEYLKEGISEFTYKLELSTE